MNAHLISLAATALALMASGGLSAAPVTGIVTEFHSPDGRVEQCIRIADFPGAEYSDADREIESAYCSLDFNTLALCPKLWSTSPGTILYRVDGDIDVWERQHCAQGNHARDAALEEPAVYKMSVNDRETSATYAPASWVYYHLSRYFGTQIHVPVAVYRSMDAQWHNRRVTGPALNIVGDKRSLRMLAAGWRFMDALETGQQSGAASAAALTDDGKLLYGVLLNSRGERYGPEINGTRESGWGAGQNHDFQQTAPYLALRSALPLAEAIPAAVHDARKNPKMAKALAADVSAAQVAFWMREILEITLLDYLLGQQDRIGNIDFNWRWYWIEDGTLHSAPAPGKDIPDRLRKFDPVRLRQSALNDNDAGIRRGYANFAKSTGMLEGLRHYLPELYRRLGLLSRDLASQGDAYHWLVDQAGLSTREADAIAERAGAAFSTLRDDCVRGALKLDLAPAQFLGGPSDRAKQASCELAD